MDWLYLYLSIDPLLTSYSGSPHHNQFLIITTLRAPLPIIRCGGDPTLDRGTGINTQVAQIHKSAINYILLSTLVSGLVFVVVVISGDYISKWAWHIFHSTVDRKRENRQIKIRNDICTHITINHNLCSSVAAVVDGITEITVLLLSRLVPGYDKQLSLSALWSPILQRRNKCQNNRITDIAI